MERKKEKKALGPVEQDQTEDILDEILPGPAILPEIPEDEVEDLIICCRHKVDGMARTVRNPPFFEVVPSTKGSSLEYDDTVTVLFLSPSPPPAISVSRKGRISSNGSRNGYTKYSFTCKHLPVDQGTGHNLLARFWPASSKPTRYLITELPQSLPVKAYRPGIWELSFSLPPFKSKSVGRKLGGDRYKSTVKTVNTKSKGIKQTEWYYEKKADSTEGYKRTKNPAKPAPKHNFSLKRDGNELDVVWLAFVSSVLVLAAKVAYVIELFSDKVPKIGWYFEAKLELFQGTIKLAWGWKEDADHRVSHHVTGTIDVVFFGGMIEGGFGLAGLAFKAQLYVNLAGRVSIAASIDLIIPKSDDDLIGFGGSDIPSKGEIVTKAGARFEAGNVVKIDANLTAGSMPMRFFTSIWKREYGWTVMSNGLVSS